MSTPQPVCPGCWAVLNPGRVPERVANAEEEICCVCGDPTVSGLRLPIDPSTVSYPTEETE